MAQSSLGSSGKEEDEQQQQKSVTDGNVNGTITRSKTSGLKKPETRTSTATIKGRSNNGVTSAKAALPSTSTTEVVTKSGLPPKPSIRSSIRKPTTTTGSTIPTSTAPTVAKSAAGKPVTSSSSRTSAKAGETLTTTSSGTVNGNNKSVPSYARSTAVSSKKSATGTNSVTGSSSGGNGVVIKTEARRGSVRVINSTRGAPSSSLVTTGSSKEKQKKTNLISAASSNSSISSSKDPVSLPTPSEVLVPEADNDVSKTAPIVAAMPPPALPPTPNRRPSTGQSLLEELSLAQEQMENDEQFLEVQIISDNGHKNMEQRPKDLAAKFGTFTKSSNARSATPSSVTVITPSASSLPPMKAGKPSSSLSSKPGSKNSSINGSKASSINGSKAGSKNGSVNGSMNSVKSPTHGNPKLKTSTVPVAKVVNKSQRVSTAVPTAPARSTSLKSTAPRAPSATEVNIKQAIEINDLKKKIIEVQLKLEEKCVSQTKLDQIIESKIREIEEKDAQMSLFKIKITELEDAIANHAENEKDLLSQLDLKSHQLTEKMKEVKNLEKEIQDMGVSMKTDKDSKFKSLRETIKNLQNDVQSLNVIIDMRNDKIKEMTEKIIEMEENLKELPSIRGVITVLKQKLEQAEISLEKKNETIRTLKEEKDYLKVQIESSSRVTKRLSMRNEELEFALSESFIRPSTPTSDHDNNSLIVVNEAPNNHNSSSSVLASGIKSSSASHQHQQQEGALLGMDISNSSESSSTSTATPTPSLASADTSSTHTDKKSGSSKLMSASYILEPGSSAIFGKDLSFEIPIYDQPPTTAPGQMPRAPIKPVTRSKTAPSSKLATPRERFRQNQLKQQQQKSGRIKHNSESSSNAEKGSESSTNNSPSVTPSPSMSRNNSSLTPSSSDTNPSSLTPSSTQSDQNPNGSCTDKPKREAPVLERQRTFDSPVSHLVSGSGDRQEQHPNAVTSHVTNQHHLHANSSHGILSDDQLSSLNSLSDDINITNEVWTSDADQDTSYLNSSRASDVSTLGDPHLDPFITSTHSIDTRM